MEGERVGIDRGNNGVGGGYLGGVVGGSGVGGGESRDRQEWGRRGREWG